MHELTGKSQLCCLISPLLHFSGFTCDVSAARKGNYNICSLFIYFLTLLRPHLRSSQKALQSLAFNICSGQMRSLTSENSAIDTDTIPALLQYQVWITNISQRGWNPSSEAMNVCNWRRHRTGPPSYFQTSCLKWTFWKDFLEYSESCTLISHIIVST